MNAIPNLTEETKNRYEEYSNFLMQVGNGRSPDGIILDSEDNSLIKLPDNLLYSTESGLESFMKWTLFQDGSFDFDSSLLALRNDEVDHINELSIDLYKGESSGSERPRIFYSSDEPVDVNEYNPISIDVLNKCNPSCQPVHVLKLKRGCPLILLRNVDTMFGLCNGTRLKLIDMNQNVLTVKIMTGDQKDQIRLLPRITISIQKDVPTPFRRTQFPVKLGFAMTINKAQGQSFRKVGVYIKSPVFSHGQLYVALSRTCSPENIKVYLDPEGHSEDPKVTKNIVWPEVLSAVWV